MNAPPRVSVAVPVYNEEEVLPELLARVGAVLRDLPGGPHQIVLVDDGSRDRTPELLMAAAASDPRIVAVLLSRNFGHQAAISAALDHATGDAVVVMDGDLQDPPEAIPQLLARFAEGYDVVYAERASRGEPLWLRASYGAFYRLIARLSDVDLPLDAGDFGVLSRRVVELLRATPERNRYLRGLRAWAGFRQAGVPVARADRGAGTSKYSVGKLLRLAFDGIFAFSVIPIRVATGIGAAGIFLALLFALYSLVARFAFDQAPRGFTALVILIVFVAGVQLLFLGVLGEYLGRVYEEVKQRPLYVVDRVAGGSPPDGSRLP